VFQDGADDRERRSGAGIQGPRTGLGAVGVAHGEGTAGAEDGGRAGALGLHVAFRRELAEEPRYGDLRRRRPAALCEDFTDRRPAPERLFEAELADEVDDRVHGEAVELLGAEDELGGEEGSDLEIGDPGQERRKVFRAIDHGRESIRDASGPDTSLTLNPCTSSRQRSSPRRR